MSDVQERNQTPRHRARRRRLSYRRLIPFAVTGIVLASLSVIGIGAGITSAAYTDQGRLNTAFSGAYAIAAVLPDNTVRVPTNNALTGTFAAAGFIPADTTALTMDVANNSKSSAAALHLAVTASGAVASELLYSAALVVDGVPATLFGNPDDPSLGVPVADIPATLPGTLASRGGLAPLENGTAWTGPVNSRGDLVLYVHLPASAGAGLSSAQTTLSVLVTSVAQ